MCYKDIAPLGQGYNLGYLNKIMKTLLILSILHFLLYSAHCQGIIYNFSCKKDGYSGQVKRVTTYMLDLGEANPDTTDNVLYKNGNLQFTKHYNEQGLLVETESYVSDNAVTHYQYDDYGNIQSISKQKNGASSGYNETFFYHPEEKTVTNKLSKAGHFGNGRFYVKKILHMDEKNNLIQLEYLDSLDLVLRSTRLYYDQKSNLIQGETHGVGGYMNKYFQTFDSTGRKRLIQSINKNGEFMFKTVFTQLDDETELMEYWDVGKEELLEKQQEITKKDQYGNIIKRYVYDLISGDARVYEYVIEYHQ